MGIPCLGNCFQTSDDLLEESPGQGFLELSCLEKNFKKFSMRTKLHYNVHDRIRSPAILLDIGSACLCLHDVDDIGVVDLLRTQTSLTVISSNRAARPSGPSALMIFMAYCSHVLVSLTSRTTALAPLPRVRTTS